MDHSRTFTLHPANEHARTIILLHGRDSTAAEFASEFLESQSSQDLTFPEIFPSYKWIFPSSNLRKAARFEQDMSQWFDTWDIQLSEIGDGLQSRGLKESITDVMDLVGREVDIVGAENVTLGGISMGCATAVLALICGGLRIGGFIGFCGWLPFQEEVHRITTRLGDIEESRERKGETVQRIRALCGFDTDVTGSVGFTTSFLATPVFLSHSRDDEVVKIELGRRLCKELCNLGCQITWCEYEDGGHWINEPKGIDDIVSFLKSIV